MGLPLFVEPWERESDSKRVSKLKTGPAPPPRTSIRRSRSVRYPRTSALREGAASPHRTTSAGRRRLELLQRPPSNLSEEEQRQFLVREAIYMRQRDHESMYARVEAEAERARDRVADRHRQENGRALLRDALSYELPSNHTGQANAREAEWDFQLSLSNRDTSQQRSAQRHAEMDPMMSSRFDAVSRPSNTDSQQARPSLPDPRQFAPAALTPRFAPAYNHPELWPDSFESQRAREHVWGPLARRSISPLPPPPPPHPAGQASYTSRNQTPRSSSNPHGSQRSRQEDINHLPPLRRMDHRRIVDGIPRRLRSASPRTREPGFTDSTVTAGSRGVDGLGDRQRSLSPGEVDWWETLVTTVADDETADGEANRFFEQSLDPFAQTHQLQRGPHVPQRHDHHHRPHPRAAVQGNSFATITPSTSNSNSSSSSAENRTNGSTPLTIPSIDLPHRLTDICPPSPTDSDTSEESCDCPLHAPELFDDDFDDGSDPINDPNGPPGYYSHFPRLPRYPEGLHPSDSTAANASWLAEHSSHPRAGERRDDQRRAE